MSIVSPTTAGCGTTGAVNNQCTGNVCVADLTCINSNSLALQVTGNLGGGVFGAGVQNYTLQLDTVSIATLGIADVNISTSSAVWYRIDLGSTQAISVEANVTAGSQLQMRLFQDCNSVSGGVTCNIATQPANCRVTSFTDGTLPQDPYYARFSVVGGPDVNATIRVVRGNPNCVNIVAGDPNLVFCSDVIGAGAYAIADVPTADGQALTDFDGFYILYQGSCNSSIKNFVCKTNFPACDSNGAITRQCLSDCQNALSGCPSNFCLNGVCQRATPCGVLPAPGAIPPGSKTGNGNGSSLIQLSVAAFALAVVALLF